MRRSLATIGALGLIASVFGFGGSAAAADPAKDELKVSPNVVISEVKPQGSDGAEDEFIELSNASLEDSVDISGWRLVTCSATGAEVTAFTFPAGTFLEPQGENESHYLVAGPDYSGAVSPDDQIELGIERTGGVMLRSQYNARVDGLGYSSTAGACVEGPAAARLPQTNTTDLSSQRNQEYKDTDQNKTDFGQILQSPQNQESV